MANETLLSVTSSDLDTPFEIDLTGFSLGGLSDFVPEGRYELEAVDVRYEPKKDNTGTNVRIDWRVIGPACPDLGKHIVCFHPAPVGDPATPEFRKKAFYIKAAIAAAFLHDGKPIPQQKVAVRPRGIKGKRVYAYIVEDTYKEQDVSTLKGYLSAEDFAAAPGPVPQRAKAAALEPRQSTRQATTAPAAQPAAAGGNGAATGNVAARPTVNPPVTTTSAKDAVSGLLEI